MIYRASPLLCSTFKGVLPSQLFEHYNGAGGLERLEFDLLVANEIADQLNDSAQSSSKRKKPKGGAKGAVARRDQRRQLFSGADTLKHLQGMMGDKGE